MNRLRAALGTLFFLGAAPGVVAGLVPWLITEWESSGPPLWLEAVGWVAVIAGAAVLLEAFGRFVVEGLGTPAPVAPPDELVVGGLYRYVRNPMYLAVASVILGQAAILGSWLLVAYAALFLVVVWSFVHWYEESHICVTASATRTTSTRGVCPGGGRGCGARPARGERATPTNRGPPPERRRDMAGSETWAGWIRLGAILLLIISALDFFQGLIAIIRDDYYVLSPNQIVVFDLTTWGWITLLWSIVLAVIGFALLAAATWARWAAIVVVSLNFIVQLGFVGSAQYPLWALTVLALNIVVLYALIVRWGDASETMRRMAESRY